MNVEGALRTQQHRNAMSASRSKLQDRGTLMNQIIELHSSVVAPIPIMSFEETHSHHHWAEDFNTISHNGSWMLIPSCNVRPEINKYINISACCYVQVRVGRLLLDNTCSTLGRWNKDSLFKWSFLWRFVDGKVDMLSLVVLVAIRWCLSCMPTVSLTSMCTLSSVFLCVTLGLDLPISI